MTGAFLGALLAPVLWVALMVMPTAFFMDVLGKEIIALPVQQVIFTLLMAGIPVSGVIGGVLGYGRMP